jgi:hypothetical protein
MENIEKKDLKKLSDSIEKFLFKSMEYSDKDFKDGATMVLILIGNSIKQMLGEDVHFPI